MFESTKWEFIDEHLPSESKFEQTTPVVKQYKSYGKPASLEIAIVKQFTFSSSFLRMSVLCKSLDKNCFDAYTKGAPEKIVELCKPETGISLSLNLRFLEIISKTTCKNRILKLTLSSRKF